MERNALTPSHTKRGQPALILEPTERSLYGGAATVQVAPTLRLTGDKRMQTTRLDPLRLRLALRAGVNSERRVLRSAEILLAIARPGILCAVGRGLDNPEAIARKARELAEERGVKARIEVSGDFATIELEEVG